MSYTRADNERILQSLAHVMDGVEAALASLAAGETDKARQAIEQAQGENATTVALFPPLVVNESTTIAFGAIYPDLYEIDLLIMIAFQWPDTSPTAITQMPELIDALADKLANLRRWRDQPWAEGRADGLASLDGLIDKTGDLRNGLEKLAPRARLDPRLYTWLGQEYKERFLNAVGDTDQLGTMYTFLFPLDNALARARWSLATGKVAGGTRRLLECRRVYGMFLDWFRQHEPIE